MSLFMRVIHLGQAFLSGYAAYHSYNAITNLQAYEATSEKLAEWSSEAAKQLAQTRATQTSGALAVRATSQTHHPQTGKNTRPTNILSTRSYSPQ